MKPDLTLPCTCGRYKTYPDLTFYLDSHLKCHVLCPNQVLAPHPVSMQAPSRSATDGRQRRSVSLGISDGASDPATPQDGTSDEAWEYEGPHDVVRAVLKRGLKPEVWQFGAATYCCVAVWASQRVAGSGILPCCEVFAAERTYARAVQQSTARIDRP